MTDWHVSKNFMHSEVACKCCGKVGRDQAETEKQILKMQELRDHLGKPITVTSWHRCEKHNREVGGSAKSAHLWGGATDIVVAGIDPREVVAVGTLLGFTDVIRYARSKFVHVGTMVKHNPWVFNK